MDASESLVEHLKNWAKKTFTPDELFDNDELSLWAINNGFKRTTEKNFIQEETLSSPAHYRTIDKLPEENSSVSFFVNNKWKKGKYSNRVFSFSRNGVQFEFDRCYVDYWVYIPSVKFVDINFSSATRE